MKRIVRFLAVVLAISSVLSFFSSAYAELKTGAEKFGGVVKKERDMEKVKEIYDDLVYRAYEFDENIVLPELEHMLDYENIKYKYVQSKRGRIQGQSIYEGPYSDSEDRWYAKDGCLIKIYAKYNTCYFCELFINEDESEGTIGWIPITYTTNKWSSALSDSRTIQYAR